MGSVGSSRQAHLHRRRDRGAGEAAQQLAHVHWGGRAFGQPAEFGELPRQLLQPARLGDQHLDRLLLRSGRAARELCHRQPDRRERIPHLVRHSARRLAEGAQPLRLDLARTPLLERVGHLAQRRPQRLELRRAPPRLVGRQRLHPPDVTGPADELVDRPAQLPRQVAPDPHRCVDEGRAHQQHHQPQPGVVVAPEGLDPLEPDRARG